jgi:hypothetical protein
MEQWLPWISTISAWAILVALFLGRNWIKAEVEKGVEYRFNKRLEKLRADLSAKENEIASLRDAVLSGRAQRQALVEKRRIEAAELVWKGVISLAPLKSVAASAAAINFEYAAKQLPKNPKLGKLFEAFLSPVADDKIPDDPAKYEQPFVSPLAWAYLLAYRTVLIGAWVRVKVLSLGVEIKGDLFDTKNMQSF